MTNDAPHDEGPTDHVPSSRSRLEPRLRLIAAVVAVIASAALPAAAQNLVVNPGFDSTTVPWTGPGVWDSMDVAGSPSSGSATYTNTSAGSAGFAFIQQCITVDPLIVGYRISAWTYVASGQTAPGYARIDAVWFTDPACTDYLEYDEIYPAGQLDVWEEAGGVVFRPYTAQSVKIQGINQKTAAGDFQVFVDQFSMVDHPSPIFGDSFETGTVGAWSSVAPGPS